MPLFIDSWKRIDRAVMHAKAFATEWTSLLKDDAYRVVVEKEDQGTWVARAIFSKSLENNLALELGEFFYQLRAALDGAIWQAVTLSEGAEPTTKVDRLEFPICNGIDPEGKFMQSGVYKHKFPQELWKWIESIQPYAAEKAVDDPDAGLPFLLEILHDCARKDRHRRLRVVAAVPIGIEYAFDFSSPAKVVFEEAIRSNFLENESKFLRFRVESIDGRRVEKAVLTTGLEIDVSVDEFPVFEGGNLADELKRFLAATRYIIDRFEKAFEGS